MIDSTLIPSNRGGWGRLPHPEQRLVNCPERWKWPAGVFNNGPVLARGQGRTYGDGALNSKGVLLDMRQQNRFIAFDRERGLLTCESGVRMSDILALVIPHGWFLQVTPGTRHVTVGGAIGNDVHGKNHHRVGTFGQHVVSLELLRSNGQRLQCSRQENSALFKATIAGLGLTGVISKATIALKRVTSPWLCSQSLRFDSLDEFFELSQASDGAFEYTVAWLDALGPSPKTGRGVFFRANHAHPGQVERTAPSKAFGRPLLNIAMELPFTLVTKSTARFFNERYFQSHRPTVNTNNAELRWRLKEQIVAPHAFFYPLDGVANWNRVYGPRGFFQYQCVLPMAAARTHLAQLLAMVQDSPWPSFLAVLKLFGDAPSAGCLSFPMKGVTLALDFPNHGASMLALFERMDCIVADAGGRIYAAKDARMGADMFFSSQHDIDSFLPHIDPGFSSDFWRRMAPTALKASKVNESLS